MSLKQSLIVYLELNLFELKHAFRNTLAFRIMQSHEKELNQHDNRFFSLCDITDKVQQECARMEEAHGHTKTLEL